MRAMEPLRDRVPMGYAVSDDKGVYLAKLAVPVATIALLSLITLMFVLSDNVDSGALALWALLATPNTVISLSSLKSLFVLDSDVRSAAIESINEHVEDSLDRAEGGESLSQRLERKRPDYQWGGLSDRHLRWMEKKYQSSVKEQAEARAKQGICARDHYSTLSSINRIGERNQRGIREAQSFLRGLDEIHAGSTVADEGTTVPTDAQPRLLSEFDEQMSRVSAQ